MYQEQQSKTVLKSLIKKFGIKKVAEKLMKRLGLGKQEALHIARSARAS